MEDSVLKHEPGAFLPLHLQIINEKIYEKAENELGETKDRRKECLSELRKLLESEPNLVACTSEDFLLQFLRVKKFDTQRAFDLLKRYYTHKLDYPNLHKNDGTLAHHGKLFLNFMNFLPLRTPEGCAVWAVRLGLWDPSSYSMEKIMSLGFMCQQQALKNPLTQICGMVSILDLKGLSWSHIYHISPTCLRGFITAVQDSFPIRHKAIHIVNYPRIFDILFMIMKPLLSLKIRKRIHFHEDVRSLHKFVPVDILPESFGGTFGAFQNIEFMNSLLDSESEFVNLNRFGYM